MSLTMRLGKRGNLLQPGPDAYSQVPSSAPSCVAVLCTALGELPLPELVLAVLPRLYRLTRSTFYFVLLLFAVLMKPAAAHLHLSQSYPCTCNGALLLLRSALVFGRELSFVTCLSVLMCRSC